MPLPGWESMSQAARDAAYNNYLAVANSAELIERRYPIYGEADLVVDSGDGSPEATAARVIAALSDCPLAATPPAAGGPE